MNFGKRVSTQEDFPRLAIYEQQESGRPIMTIVFKNPEFISIVSLIWWLVVVVLVIAVLPVLVFAFTLDGTLPTVLVIGGYLFATAYAITRARSPIPIPRRIELDFLRDQLTIYRRDRVTLWRSLAFHDLNVEDHPDAERAKQERMERGDKGLTNREKQHALIGWFGAGGSEQVILLARGEWPCRHSLREVRIAMLWARDRAMDQPAISKDGKARDLFPPLD